MCAITTLPTLILFATEGSAFKFVFEIENYFLTGIPLSKCQLIILWFVFFFCLFKFLTCRCAFRLGGAFFWVRRLGCPHLNDFPQGAQFSMPL